VGAMPGYFALRSRAAKPAEQGRTL